MSTQTLKKVPNITDEELQIETETATTQVSREIQNFLSSIGSELSISLFSVQGWITQRTGKTIDLETIAELLNKTPGLRKQIGDIIFIKE